jgi:hypothetical protein
MSIATWLWSLRIRPAARRRGNPRRAVPKRPATFRANVETLEDRCLLSLFAPFTPFPIIQAPVSVAVGDFNGDGKADLAAANEFNNTVSVLLGKGDGTFAAAPSSPITGLTNPASVAVGDFNHDGKLDLAVALSASPGPNGGSNGAVEVLLGNGDGTFQTAPNSPVSVPNPASMAVGDFNRDGIPDLAVASGDNTVRVLISNGDGSFVTTERVPVGSNPSSVAVGDFNHDGTLDLAVANQNDGTVSVRLGLGDGTFGFAPNGAIPTGNGARSVVVGDFDGNGTPDLAVVNQGANNVSLLLGNGDGTFHSAPGSPLPVGNSPRAAAVGDFNRDGIPDLAVPNGFSDTVSVLLGNGDGTFQAATSYPAGNEPTAVAVGDFNQDGAPDLVLTSFLDSAVDVFLNQARVTTTAVASFPSPAVAGELVTFTATVTPAVPATGTPTGLVEFEDGTGPLVTFLGSATLDGNGQAQLSIDTLGTGYHDINAYYVGDPRFTPSLSPVLKQLINQDHSFTTLALSADPALAGQPLTLTATVGPTPPGFGPPTGTVLFLDGSATIGSGTLSGGVATFTTSALAPGGFGNFPPHLLTAVYVGDSNFTVSNSNAQTEVVDVPTPVVTGISPSTLPEGSADFTLTLTGSNFLGGATVQWNGTPLTITAAGGTQIQVTVPAALVADEGTATVTVTNPFLHVSSLPQTFTIADAALTASGANISVFGNKKFSGTVATFTDGNPGATAGDFTALITWDNGTVNLVPVTGTGPNNTGPFTVTGTHTFAAFTNAHTVTVTIFDKGGNTVTLTDNVIDPPAPGNPTPAPAGDPPAVPVVLPVDEVFAALEPAAQRRRRHHRHATGGHHPVHHAQPRMHRRTGSKGWA